MTCPKCKSKMPPQWMAMPGVCHAQLADTHPGRCHRFHLACGECGTVWDVDIHFREGDLCPVTGRYCYVKIKSEPSPSALACVVQHAIREVEGADGSVVPVLLAVPWDFYFRLLANCAMETIWGSSRPPAGLDRLNSSAGWIRIVVMVPQAPLSDYPISAIPDSGPPVIPNHHDVLGEPFCYLAFTKKENKPNADRPKRNPASN